MLVERTDPHSLRSTCAFAISGLMSPEISCPSNRCRLGGVTSTGPSKSVVNRSTRWGLAEGSARHAPWLRGKFQRMGLPMRITLPPGSLGEAAPELPCVHARQPNRLGRVTLQPIGV
jgi:hypothetical protein